MRTTRRFKCSTALLGHVILGHTTEADFADDETTPRSLREVEAESVALLCCESLGLEGTEFCRGYSAIRSSEIGN
jgi:hypothetical protein